MKSHRHHRSARSILIGFLCLLSAPWIQGADPVLIPSLEAETLLGKDFRIPKDFGTTPTWLVLGFTKDSAKATTECSEKLESSFKGVGFSGAILQGAPFFIKGVIKNGIRSTVPENRRDRYLILNEGRDALKTLTGFDERSENDAYIVGLTPKPQDQYEVAFRSHGTCDSPHFAALTKMIRALVTPPVKKRPE